MDRTATLVAARSALAATAGRIADLIGSQPHLDVRLNGGSVWTVREAAVHLVDWDSYADMASGVPSPLESVTLDDVAEANAQFIADIPETDPGKVAGFIRDAVARFLRALDKRPGDQQVDWHGGLRLDLARLAAIALGEMVLHGYDIATALGAPWPIDPGDALLVLDGYFAMDPLFLNPETTRDSTAAYRIAIRGGPTHTVRFTGGHYEVEPPGAGTVDCEISADPAAYLLVRSGRLSQWPAIAMELVSLGPARPDLAVGYFDLFLFP